MTAKFSTKAKNDILNGISAISGIDGAALAFDAISITNTERAGVCGVDIAYQYKGKDTFYVFKAGASISEPIYLHGFTGRMPFEITQA